MGRSCLRDSPGLSPLPLLDTKPCGAQPVTKPCGAQLPRLCPTELRAGKGIAQSREHPGSGSTSLHSCCPQARGTGRSREAGAPHRSPAGAELPGGTCTGPQPLGGWDR